MLGYDIGSLKGAGLNFPIRRMVSILMLFASLVIFPRQTFSKMYGLVTDQGTIPGNVVVVNLEDKIVVNTIPVGDNPEGIVVDSKNGLAYVADSGSNRVSVIEINIPKSRTIDPPITITGSPHHLGLTPDGSYLLVTKSSTLGNGIEVIDTSSRSVLLTIIPQDVFFAPRDIVTDANYAYVSYPDDGTVLLLELLYTDNILSGFVEDWRVITSPDHPGRLLPIFGPDYVYVTTENNVIQIDPYDLIIEYPFPANCFNAPAHLAFHPPSSNLYVSNKAGNSVTIIDIANPSVCSSIAVGISPYSISFDPYGTYAYVVNKGIGMGTISIIDPASSTSPPSLVDTISDPKLITPIEIAIIEGPLNSPPYEPFAPYPQDEQMGVPVSTTLSWEGGDPDPEDFVTYDVFMGTNLEMGLEQICTAIEHPDTFCTPPSPLGYGTTYYWMVVATDHSGEISEVPYPYWSFTTEEIAPPCEVTITPDSATVTFGEIVQFSALTICEGESVSGDYIWNLTSSIGSSLDENGLYKAGTTEGMDIVTAIDLANGEITDTTSVTVVSQGPPCMVTISPPSATVSSGETLIFSAITTPLSPGTECAESSYLWAIDSPIGSSITQEGLYTAGINNTGGDRLDVITVTDTANENITSAAEVTVVAEGAHTVIITPEDIILPSLHSQQFTAQTLSAGIPLPEEECHYHWEISPPSTIGSIIDEHGLYTAGLNTTETLVTETIRVYDTAHDHASAATPVTLLVKYVSIPHLLLPPGPLPTSYRMIAVGPIWPIDGDALRIITGSSEYNPYLIRLFRWDGELNEGQGGYREYPDVPELQPGIGIWAITLPGGFLLVDGTPIDASSDFPITLQPGWNQIGNPSPYAVDWSQVSNITEVEIPWSFYGAYLPSPILIPWNGYFVYNNSSSPVTIYLPLQGSEAATPKTCTPLSEEEEGFQLQIGAQNIPFFWLQDTYNFIGIAEGSTVEHDPKDLHEPPPISSDQVSLYFSHEWGGKAERYTTDFRSLDSEREVFEFTVNPGSGIISLMRIFWPDMAKVPKEYKMECTDLETGITLNMRDVGEYWFLSYLGTDKHFKISMIKTSP